MNEVRRHILRQKFDTFYYSIANPIKNALQNKKIRSFVVFEYFYGIPDASFGLLAKLRCLLLE